jgi:hypothetical protein
MNQDRKEKVYLTIQDVEELYSLKASFQAKYRTEKKNPMPYIKPGGSKNVLYNKELLEEWLSSFMVNTL